MHTRSKLYLVKPCVWVQQGHVLCEDHFTIPSADPDLNQIVDCATAYQTLLIHCYVHGAGLILNAASLQT